MVAMSPASIRKERHIGYVPQDYALFQNLTVRENVAYGLRARRLPEVEIVARVNSMPKDAGPLPAGRAFPDTGGGEKTANGPGTRACYQPRAFCCSMSR